MSDIYRRAELITCPKCKCTFEVSPAPDYFTCPVCGTTKMVLRSPDMVQAIRVNIFQTIFVNMN